MLRLLVLVTAACALLFAPRPAVPGPERTVDAGTALRLDVQGLVSGAELVLEGRVLAKRALPTARGRIATELDLEVHRTFLGDDQLRRTVRLPGGLLPDGSGILIPGMPTVAQGEDVILFLTEDNGQGARMPVGLAQGKLRVATNLAGEKVLVRHHAGLELAPAPGLPTGHVSSQEHLDYAQTLAEIHAAVEHKRLGGR